MSNQTCFFLQRTVLSSPRGIELRGILENRRPLKPEKNPTNLPIKDQKYVTYENSRYTAKLPWKEEVCILPSNKIIAQERTKNVIRR